MLFYDIVLIRKDEKIAVLTHATNLGTSLRMPVVAMLLIACKIKEDSAWKGSSPNVAIRSEMLMTKGVLQ